VTLGGVALVDGLALGRLTDGGLAPPPPPRRPAISGCRPGAVTDQQVTITARENGPYLVRGPILLRDADGNEYQLEGERAALCRCGGSTTKPFCDGTHSRIGFEAAERAVQEQEG
jgi:CDGSH-type Zn-finger protein